MKWYDFIILCHLCVVKCYTISASELEDFSNFLKETSQLDHFVKSADPVNDYDEDEIISDHAWEESGKFEGDLILNERQRRLIVADVAEGLARNGLTDTTKRWPNNEVVYFIQKDHFSSGQIEAIQSGIDDLARASCVKFTPYQKGDRDAVVIQGSRRGCFSQVGYQGGYQVLNLSGRHPVGRGCFRHGTVVHELLHTLGFYHMQSSPDRDDYINVAWDNIIKPARHNFRKYNSFSVSDFGVGYDYDSVLHYSRKAFSSNGQDTLVPKQSGADIGQRIGLSDKDSQKLHKMYCDADSDLSQDNEGTNKKHISKKKAKNKPFEGHGIGYEQGKTVIIKLPTAEVYKLRDSSQIHMFDYFSSSPETVSATPFQGFGNIQEVEKSLIPSTKLNLQNKQSIPEVLQDKATDGESKPKTVYSDVSDEAYKISESDDDILNEAFHRLLQTQGYPREPTNNKYDKQLDKNIFNEGPESVTRKNIYIVNSYPNVDMIDQQYKSDWEIKPIDDESSSKPFSPHSLIFSKHTTDTDLTSFPQIIKDEQADVRVANGESITEISPDHTYREMNYPDNDKYMVIEQYNPSDTYVSRSVHNKNINPDIQNKLNKQHFNQQRDAYYKLYNQSKEHHNIPTRNEHIYTLFSGPSRLKKFESNHSKR